MLYADFISFFVFFFDIVLVIALEGAICIQLPVANNTEGGLVLYVPYVPCTGMMVVVLESV